MILSLGILVSIATFIIHGYFTQLLLELSQSFSTFGASEVSSFGDIGNIVAIFEVSKVFNVYFSILLTVLAYLIFPTADYFLN